MDVNLQTGVEFKNQSTEGNERKFTFAIHIARGSEGAMRTAIKSYADSCQKAVILANSQIKR